MLMLAGRNGDVVGRRTNEPTAATGVARFAHARAPGCPKMPHPEKSCQLDPPSLNELTATTHRRRAYILRRSVPWRTAAHSGAQWVDIWSARHRNEQTNPPISGSHLPEGGCCVLNANTRARKFKCKRQVRQDAKSAKCAKNKRSQTLRGDLGALAFLARRLSRIRGTNPPISGSH